MGFLPSGCCGCGVEVLPSGGCERSPTAEAMFYSISRSVISTESNEAVAVSGAVALSGAGALAVVEAGAGAMAVGEAGAVADGFCPPARLRARAFPNAGTFAVLRDLRCLPDPQL